MNYQGYGGSGGGGGGGQWGQQQQWGQQAQPQQQQQWQQPQQQQQWQQQQQQQQNSWQQPQQQGQDQWGGAQATGQWGGANGMQGGSSPSKPPQQLNVSGCTHATVAAIVHGNFNVTGENHGKPTYRKDTRVPVPAGVTNMPATPDGMLDVMLYYWDERDGPTYSGWWFGPKVGGDQVWAYHPERTAPSPPSVGWKVPYDGPIDSNFKVEAGHKQQQPASLPVRNPPNQQSQWQQGNNNQGQQWQQNQNQSPKGQGKQNSWQQNNTNQGQNQGWHQNQDNNNQQWQQNSIQGQNSWQQNQGNDWGQKNNQGNSWGQKNNQGWQQSDQNNWQGKQQNSWQGNQQNSWQAAEDEKRKFQEAQKAKLQEMLRKKQEDEAAKKEAEEKKKMEMQAVMNIRRALAKVRLAQSENFEEMVKEADEVFEQEKGNVGDMLSKLTEEHERFKKEATSRVMAVREAKKKEEEKKEAEEKAKKEAEEKNQVAIKEFTSLVEAMEEAVGGISTEADSRLEAAAKDGVDVDAVRESMKGLDELFTEAKTSHTKATEYLKDNADVLKRPITTASGLVKALGEAERAAANERQMAVAKLMGRLMEGQKKIDLTLKDVQPKRDAAVKKAVAKVKTAEIDKLFTKYDKDKDGMWSDAEIVAFAKGEFKFTVTKQAATDIVKVYAGGKKGVPATKMILVKIAVGALRETSRDEKRQEYKKALQKALKDLQESIEAQIAEVQTVVEAAEAEVRKAEDKVNPCLAQVRKLDEAGLLSLAAESDKSIEAACKKVQASNKSLGNLDQHLDKRFEDELKAFIKDKSQGLDTKAKRYELRLNRMRNLNKKLRARVVERKHEMQKAARDKLLKVLKYNQKTKELSEEDFFKAVNGKADGAITETQFLKWFDGADKMAKNPAAADDTPAEEVTLTKEELKAAFGCLVDDGKKTISKDKFLRLVRVFMKVIKETALTADLNIQSTETVRRLEMNEILEVIEGPVTETELGISRVRVKTTKDEKEGWATVLGNAGTPFLEVCKHSFKVVKEAVMTSSFDELEAEGKNNAVTLKVGEVLDVLQWPKKHDSGNVRLQGQARKGGSSGWFTVINSDGTSFLVPV
eukprot:TRINITY_DN1761_c1_g1_i8.p1 TRINITY_DN1761_c1_g1~~TRINITY_DN1761_c1_g1_i8.p1  ORF type:complete len:1093 (+),score=350.88 TRINITY_DN1761_c1_g1_i8:75-3353(+)